MYFLRDSKVFTKVMLGFFGGVGLMVGLAAFSIAKTRNENVYVAELRDNWLPSFRSGLQIKDWLNKVRISEFRAARGTNQTELRDSEAAIPEFVAGYRDSADEYRKLTSDPDESRALSEIETLVPQYLDFDREIVAPVDQNKANTALDLLRGRSYTIYAAIEQEIHTIVEIDVIGARREGQQIGWAHSIAVELVVGLLISVACVGIAVALVIARGLRKQLGGEPRDAAELANEIATRNLRVPVRLTVGDRLSLMFSLGKMRDQLEATVRDIKVSGESMSIVAGEIAQGHADLAQRTEKYATVPKEAASSIEPLTSTFRQKAENAKPATTLASAATGVARRNGEVVDQIVKKMTEISDSSAKMAKIIPVIEGIAFQTSILVLNAAVEVARAREQGRGFAVVVGEVRTLAQRSATAAKEIKELIGESANRGDQGSKFVAEAGGKVGEIDRFVRRMADIMDEIAVASEEQSKRIGQVNIAVAQMDVVTQKNAVLVEEASAAAQSMARQAQELHKVVADFEVGNTGVSEAQRSRDSVELLQRVRKARSTLREGSVSIGMGKLNISDRRKVVDLGLGMDDWKNF